MWPPRKPQVIVLGPASPVPGGIAAVVDSLGESALRDRFEIVTLNTGKVTARDRGWHVAVGHQVRLFSRLVGLLVHGRGGLVHIHTCSGFVFWRDAAFLVLARLFRRRVVWHVHGGGFAEFVENLRGVRRAALELAFVMSHAAIVLSPSWRERLRRHLRPRRWAVVENGVALAPSAVVGARRGQDFLFVGTLDNVKGAEDLVAATAIAARRGFPARVRIAGGETSPGQRERLVRLAAREGISDRVEFPGLISGREKADAFTTAAVFVLPSYVEGLPMALLEAMAHGLPSIVTEVGSIPEVVTDGVEGFLVKPGDVDALAERMTRLAADASLRQRMGSAARRRVEANYTAEAMAAKVADVYQTTMEDR